MTNTVIRREGYPRIAMLSMLVPAIVNLILGPIFILGLSMGMSGAAWATSIGYAMAGLFHLVYFLSNKTKFKLTNIRIVFDFKILVQIFSLGSVSFFRQGIISALAIVLNNQLLKYGGITALSTYGIVQRIMIFTNVPINGIIQGFLPIAGYSYGARKWERLNEAWILSIKSGAIMALVNFVMVMFLTEYLVGWFTDDLELVDITVKALRICYLASPFIVIHLMSSAYFQAIGKALPAFFLAVTKQGLLLIPFLLIFPKVWGVQAIWVSFPLADIFGALICFLVLKKDVQMA